MPLPQNTLIPNAEWPAIYEFQDKLREFVLACYPDDSLKAEAAWEHVKNAKTIGTMAQQLGAEKQDVAARLSGIWMCLHEMQVPNAGQLQQWFHFTV